jgi:hypothetical protein
MANPGKYTPSFSFAGYQTTSPTRPLPGVRVDTEYNNIAQSLGDTIDALADIRRDDGKLQNGIVTVESLDPGMAIGILPPANWVTATEYKPPQSVWNGNKLYQCVVNHISTVFADDLAAGYWNLVVDFDPPIDAAEASAAAAAASATQAAGSASAAAGSASAADASKTAAAASASAADASKTAAANSATSASGSASTATTKAAEAAQSAANAAASAALYPDAPSDGNYYGRLNAAWAKIPAGGGGGGGGTEDYTFNVTPTPPPASGNIRLNNATQPSATLLYMHYVNNAGVNTKNFLDTYLKPESDIYLQDRDDPAKWQLFTITTPFTDNTTYATVPVVWKAGGAALLGQKIIVSIKTTGGGSIKISDTPPSNPTAGTLWWESDTGNTYIWYDDGNTKQWVQINAAVAATATAEARNRVVNGAMQVSQENGNTAGTTTAYYAADQWGVSFTTTGTITSQRVQSVTPNGSKDRFRATVTVADASLTANEYLALQQIIEGNRLADFRWGSVSAKQAILRFGFKGPAGTYAVALRNSVPNRAYIAQFTVSAGQANTDTEQVLVIPGDTTGTWLTDTGIGTYLSIALAAGTGFHGVTGWQAGSSFSTAACSNGMATAGAVFELFDVGLYLDPLATGVPPTWAMPDEAQELIACQRYYEKVQTFWAGQATASVSSGAVSFWKMTKRIAPAVSGVSGGAVAFANTIGTLAADTIYMNEQRAATATGAGIFYSTVTANARM